MAKKFRLEASQIRPILRPMGAAIASDRILADGARVGQMERNATDREGDSGWSFFAGDEDDAYCEDPSRFGVYDVNTIANYDEDIIPFLWALPGSRFVRHDGGPLVEARDSVPDASAGNIPPGMSVVSGRYAIGEGWSITLPSPFRQRREDDNLVLWRPLLTLWIHIQASEPQALAARRAARRAGISPSAYDVREDARGLSYRLREDSTDAAVPSLYVLVLGANSDLRLGVYLDRESDVDAARTLIESCSDAQV